MVSPPGMRCAFFWVPGHVGIRGNEIADGLARGSSALRFFGPEPALGVSRRDLHKRLGRWLVNQHGELWRGVGDTQRQAREFISGPSLGTRAKFMTLSRIQSRVVTGLLTGHNSLKRHLYLLGLSNTPLRWWCEKTSAHVLCECEALASRRQAYLSSFFLEPGDMKYLNLGRYGTTARLRGSHDSILGTKGLSYLRPRCIGAERPRTHMQSIYL